MKIPRNTYTKSFGSNIYVVLTEIGEGAHIVGPFGTEEKAQDWLKNYADEIKAWDLEGRVVRGVTNKLVFARELQEQLLEIEDDSDEDLTEDEWRARASSTGMHLSDFAPGRRPPR